MKSAAGFLQDDAATITASRGRALGLNPHASEVYRVPGRIASRHYRFHDAVKLQRRALEVNSDDYRARAYLAFDLLRLGDEKEGRLELEKTFEADRYNVMVFNMLNLLDTLGLKSSDSAAMAVLRQVRGFLDDKGFNEVSQSVSRRHSEWSPRVSQRRHTHN